jgi:hypothetical protein
MNTLKNWKTGKTGKTEFCQMENTRDFISCRIKTRKFPQEGEVKNPMDRSVCSVFLDYLDYLDFIVFNLSPLVWKP